MEHKDKETESMKLISYKDNYKINELRYMTNACLQTLKGNMNNKGIDMH